MKVPFIAVSFGFALLGAVGYGAWLAVDAMVAVFASLYPEAANLTAMASGPALTAAWVLARGAHPPDVRSHLCDALIAIRKDLGADIPVNAAHELEQLLLPIAQAVERRNAPSR